MDKIESRGLGILAMSASSGYMALGFGMVNFYCNQYRKRQIAEAELEFAKYQVELSKKDIEVVK